MTNGLRKCSLTVAMLAMMMLLIAACAHAQSGPSWLTLDANLEDWGVNPGADTPDWTPDLVNGCFYTLDDDTTYAGTASGGEWYDIEALYVSLEVVDSTQYLSWALVTSYGGVEAWDISAGYAANPVALRDGLYVSRPYSRHPVLAMSFASSDTTVTPTTPWQYGLVMAPNTSVGLLDPAGPYDTTGRATGGNTHYNFGYGDDSTYRTPDADGAVAFLAATPELYDVDYADWRGPHPKEFPGNADAFPVDFDVNNPANDNLSVGGAVFAGVADGGDNGNGTSRMTYTEDAAAGEQLGSPWWQAENFIWEGWIELPSAEVDLAVYDQISLNYSEWCGNDDLGDSITYGVQPPSDSPELGTWALLACTSVLGGMFRRRRSG